jgi:hypothetical protein
MKPWRKASGCLPTFVGRSRLLSAQAEALAKEDMLPAFVAKVASVE